MSSVRLPTRPSLAKATTKEEADIALGVGLLAVALAQGELEAVRGYLSAISRKGLPAEEMYQWATRLTKAQAPPFQEVSTPQETESPTTAPPEK